MDWRTSRTKRIPPRDRFRIGMPMSPSLRCTGTATSPTRDSGSPSQSPDMVGPKLAALRAYQHSLAAPPPPAGSFDAAAAGRGRALFGRSCASCHVGVTGTDNNAGKLHVPAETGVDGAYAARTATKAYRTTPLRALWQHAPYFHDASAATLADVVTHYNTVRKLGLTAARQHDLVEYLKSL